jgi:AcrR family transcriptional regulator
VSERTPSRVEEAVRVARDILEHQGPDGLTMRAIAAAMGIRAPSLYKHVEGKDELEVLLVVEALRESGQAMRDALAPLGARPPRRTALLALGASAYPRVWRPGPPSRCCWRRGTSTGRGPRGHSRTG